MVKESGTITKAYLEETFVTKSYLEKGFVTKAFLKKELSNFVTKDFLHQELQGIRAEMKEQMKELKYDILHETRSMMHETLEGAMENMKAYYTEQTNRHIGILMQASDDKMLYYKDELRGHKDTLGEHEKRLTLLETSR